MPLLNEQGKGTSSGLGCVGDSSLPTPGLQGQDLRPPHLKLVHHLPDPTSLLPDDVPVQVKGHLHFNGDRDQRLQSRGWASGLSSEQGPWAQHRLHGENDCVATVCLPPWTEHTGGRGARVGVSAAKRLSALAPASAPSAGLSERDKSRRTER